MKITTIGVGYVGLVTGTVFADMGNDSVCLDIDEEKIANLKKGIMPIYEPQLEELVQKNIKEKRLTFTTDKKYAIQASDIIFNCVNTPQKHNGEADLSFVERVAEDIAKYMNGYKLIVNKSTVPVGTADLVKRIIREKQNAEFDFDVASNPEFLREGWAISDCQIPDRVVVGTDTDRAKELIQKIYSTVERTGKPIMFTDIHSAEIIKYASNAMLATRISFMNELAHLAEKTGADIKAIAKGMGLDTRIGPKFLQAGIGYGGSCFPKDVRALIYTMENYGLKAEIVRAIDHVNEQQKMSVVPKLQQYLPDLDGKTVALWGLSFKPRTDDMREAPALTVIDQLHKLYAKVRVYDPVAMENAKKLVKNNVYFATDMYDAVRSADALVLVTEWDDFRQPDFDKIKSLMNEHILIDVRNVYDPKEMRNLGFKYASIGRGVGHK